METAFSTLTARDYLRILFRRASVIVVLAVSLTATVYLGLQLQTPYYEAHVKMLISAKKLVESPYYGELTGYSSGEKITVTQSEIVKSVPILQRVVDALALQMFPLDYEKRFSSPLKKWIVERKEKASIVHKLPPDQQRAFRFRVALERLRESITVKPVLDTNTFTIGVRDFDPLVAATIANAVSRSYVIFDLEQQLAEIQLKYGGKHPQVVQLRDNINKMLKTMDGSPISNADAIGPASVKIIEQAVIPIQPVGKSKKLFLLIALVMSLILGITLAFLLEYLDPTFKTPLEAEKTLGIPLLGSVPQKKSMRPAYYQNLADQMYLLAKDKKLKTLLVSPVEDCLPAEIVSELGKQLASKFGQRVLLIDANLRDPSVHKFFSIEAQPGLAELLEGKAIFQQIAKKTKDGLEVLPAGKTELNPITLLDSRKMTDLIADSAQHFDLILITSPGLVKFKDAAVLSAYADGTAIVVDENKTRREVAKASAAPLEQKKVNLIGSILNQRTFPIPQIIYQVF